jgi:hypothetical protein
MPHRKNLSIGLVAVCLTLLSFQSIQAQATHSGVDNPLLGPISIDQLFDLDGWFGSDFLTYLPDRELTNQLKKHLDGVTILCFLGTWCEDSELHVPRMLKVLQQAGIDPSQFKMFGIDKNFRSPAGDEMPYNIEKAPTFVLVHDGAEIGRITEEPIGTLERDMIAIIRKSFPEEFPLPKEPIPTYNMDELQDAFQNAGSETDGDEMNGDIPEAGDVAPMDKTDPPK